MSQILITGEYKNSFVFCCNLDCVTDSIYVFIFAVQAKVHQCAVTRGLKSLLLERKVSRALDFTLYWPGTPLGWS